MRVLLLEQAPFLAAIIQHALKKQGHEVLAAKKVLQLQPLVLLSHDKEEMRPEGGFDVALVDGMNSEQLSGPITVKSLTESHVACFGLAAIPADNDAMRAAGAVGAAKKSTAVAALYFGVIKPQDVCAESCGTLDAKITEAAALETQRKCKEMCRLNRLITKSLALHSNLEVD